MMKSLFCILSLALVLLGIGHDTGKNMQGFREDAGVSAFSVSLASFTSADSASSFLYDSSSDDALSSSKVFFSKSSESYTLGILTALSVPRTSTPVKTLKFNDVSTILQLLSSQESKLPEGLWKNLYSETNSLKYSNRYYLYALAHILI